MAMGHSFEDFFTEPLPKFHHAFLMTGGAEMPSLAKKCQEVLIVALFASDPGKSIAQDTAVKVAVDDPHHIGPKKAIALIEPLLINLLEPFKVVLDTLVVLRTLRIARLINRCRHRYCHLWAGCVQKVFPAIPVPKYKDPKGCQHLAYSMKAYHNLW